MNEAVGRAVEAWVGRNGREWADLDPLLEWLFPFGTDWRSAWAECKRADHMIVLAAVRSELTDCLVDAALLVLARGISVTPSAVRWPREAAARCTRWREGYLGTTPEDKRASEQVFRELREQQSEPPLSEQGRMQLSHDLARVAMSAFRSGSPCTLTVAISVACRAIAEAHDHHPILLEQYQRYVASQHRRALAHATTAAAHGVSAANAAYTRSRMALLPMHHPARRDLGAWARHEVEESVAFDLYHAVRHAMSAAARMECGGAGAWSEGTVAFASALGLTSLRAFAGAGYQGREPGEARKAALEEAVERAEQRIHDEHGDFIRDALGHRCEGSACASRAKVRVVAAEN